MAYDEWHVFCRYMLLQILFGPTASVMSHQHFSLIKSLWLHCQCIFEPLASCPHHGCYSCLVRPCFGSPCSGVCLLGQMYCFGDANFRGINVIADLEEVFKGCFLSLFLCWWGFYAELHVVDEPTFCHNQLLWLFLRLHLVLPLERYSKPIILLLCLLLWFLLYVQFEQRSWSSIITHNLIALSIFALVYTQKKYKFFILFWLLFSCVWI